MDLRIILWALLESLYVYIYRGSMSFRLSRNVDHSSHKDEEFTSTVKDFKAPPWLLRVLAPRHKDMGSLCSWVLKVPPLCYRKVAPSTSFCIGPIMAK